MSNSPTVDIDGYCAVHVIFKLSFFVVYFQCVATAPSRPPAPGELASAIASNLRLCHNKDRVVV